MDANGWRAAIAHAVTEAINHGATIPINGIAQQLAEEDEAKQLLRNAGYGATGVSLLETVKEILEQTANHRI